VSEDIAEIADIHGFAGTGRTSAASSKLISMSWQMLVLF